MLAFQVNSIPLKDVIISLAHSFEVPYFHNCDEYYITLPENLGSGEIRGVNFDNGLALLIYKLYFKEDVRLEFTLDEIHPLKFINSIHGPLIHEFANEDIKHSIDEFNCAIVASEGTNGHIMEFSKNVLHEVISIEVDRERFSRKESCEIKKMNSKLQSVLLDVRGLKQFYDVGSCGVYFKDILHDVSNYEDFSLGRKLNLQSVSIQMFINQIIQYDDDSLRADKRVVLRIDELKRVEEVSVFIKENINEDLSIKKLSRMSGLNPKKLQNGFKYLFATSINEFITNKRLEKAQMLLQNNEYRVRDVVSAIGLESNSYFSKIYKERYGITPKIYKKLFS
ncbi:AraC family transcriptional regulator [Epilithonimonas sp.]|uniref:helix-turn-helix domain-containing protein n=1 Tax=Epilithonimonas sp. TaxID=2894511 RepID=UPI0028A19732|nr:AraC family transcriptional regulator [Epilithonimonas sp.]